MLLPKCKTSSVRRRRCLGAHAHAAGNVRCDAVGEGYSLTLQAGQILAHAALDPQPESVMGGLSSIDLELEDVAAWWLVGPWKPAGTCCTLARYMEARTAPGL